MALTCKSCGSEDANMPARGRYANMCAACRPAAAPKSRTVVHSEIDADVRAAHQRKGMLKRACQELTAKADKLERTLDDRELARIRAMAALRDFKDSLQLVGRVAQSMLNQKAEPAPEADE